MPEILAPWKAKTGGLWLEVSPGKKLVRPHLIQKAAIPAMKQVFIGGSWSTMRLSKM
jgi:hypothetical protein